MALFVNVLGEKYNKDLSHEQLEALLEVEFNKLKQERDAFKVTSEKNASEAADYKKKFNEKLTDAERKEAEYQEIIKTNKALLRDKSIADYTAKFIGLGYSDDLAKETAIAQVDGQMDKVFENFKKHKELVDADVKKKLLERTPAPQDGGQPTGITKESFAKMGYAERVNLMNTNPTLYAELTK